MRQTALI